MYDFNSIEFMPDTGPVEELEGVTGSELLNDISQRAQRIWLQVYGETLVQRELPKAYAAWVTNERRQQFGGVALFLKSWFQNVMEELERKEEREAQAKAKEALKVSTATPPRALVLTPKECKPAWFNGPDGVTEMVGVCSVHRSFEKCEREGRG
jgi:hypothetical protein